MFKKEFNGFIIEIFREYFLNPVISIIIRNYSFTHSSKNVRNKI